MSLTSPGGQSLGPQAHSYPRNPTGHPDQAASPSSHPHPPLCSFDTAAATRPLPTLPILLWSHWERRVMTAVGVSQVCSVRSPRERVRGEDTRERVRGEDIRA